MADMTTIKGRIAETIYPNGQGAITAESHQALLLEMVDDINAKKADKEEVTFVDNRVTILANETRSSVRNLQDELTELSERIDNLPKGEVFDAEGNYPSLRVGTADTAGDLAGRGESVPAEFGFRASGGKSIKDGRAYIKRIKGNSVVWNQGIENVLSGSTSVRAWIPRRGLDYASIDNGEITLSFDAQYDAFGNSIRQRINVKAGDKFFISYEYDSHNVDEFGRRMFISFTSGWSSRGGLNDACCAKGGDITGHVEAIGVVPSRDDIDSICIFFCYTGITSPDTTPLKVANFRIVNLTKMFGAEEAAKINTIEDYIARKPFVADEYAYNEGEVIHCNTESIKSVGDNAWDEQWELGSINTTTGENSSSTGNIRAINYIDIIGGAKYYCTNTGRDASDNYYVLALFYDQDKKLILNPYGRGRNYEEFNNKTLQLPSNARYMRFYLARATTYNHDIMISLVHSGWKQDTDAGYQEYWQDTLPLPIIRKYFPDGMKKAGTAHDEIRFNKASGKWEYSKSKTGGGKIKSVDLGTLSWSAVNTDILPNVFHVKIADIITPSTSADYLDGLLCTRYGMSTKHAIASMDDMSMLRYNGYVYVKDTSCANLSELNSALQDVIFYYESNDWEWVELDVEDQNFRDYYNVADFGTEMSQSSVPSANFSADIIYQFNAVDMIREHELEITELQKVIATMQAQLTSLINGGQ